MKIRYKKMNIDIKFDKHASLPDFGKIDENLFFKIVATSKIHNISQNHEALYMLDDDMQLTCNDDDIKNALDIFLYIDVQGIVPFDFKKTYDYQYILMKSGIDIDVELFKISKAILKKMKCFDNTGEEKIISFFLNITKNKTKKDLRLISSILNNFIYERKINNIKKIGEDFVSLRFNSIHRKVLEFNK